MSSFQTIRIQTLHGAVRGVGTGGVDHDLDRSEFFARGLRQRIHLRGVGGIGREGVHGVAFSGHLLFHCSNRSFRRADAITLAPSRAIITAVARPIPLDAPTTDYDLVFERFGHFLPSITKRARGREAIYCPETKELTSMTCKRILTAFAVLIAGGAARSRKTEFHRRLETECLQEHLRRHARARFHDLQNHPYRH